MQFLRTHMNALHLTINHLGRIKQVSGEALSEVDQIRYDNALEWYELFKKTFFDTVDEYRQHQKKLYPEAYKLAQEPDLLAETHAIPDKIKAKVGIDGQVHAYFGGRGSPDGYGHAHYVINPDNTLYWTRPPGERKGTYHSEQSTNLPHAEVQAI